MDPGIAFVAILAIPPSPLVLRRSLGVDGRGAQAIWYPIQRSFPQLFRFGRTANFTERFSQREHQCPCTTCEARI
jgi:hypothetical protein